MQDEEMDNMDELIREASNSYHPVYNDKAWEKMEVLLDKHLPVGEERRRPVFFYLLLALVAGGAFFMILYPWEKKANIPVAVIENRQAAGLTKDLFTSKQLADTKQPAGNTKINSNSSISVTAGSIKNESVISLNPASAMRRLTSKRSNVKVSSSDMVAENTDGEEGVKESNAISISEIDKSVKPVGKIDLNASAAGQMQDQKHNKDVQALQPGIVTAKVNTDAVKNVTPISSGPESGKLSAKGKTKKGFVNNFALTVSAGPDLSFVGLNDVGKVKLSYGAGLRYTFSKRLAVSSGFYKSKKIYSAEPGEYHPPTGYWTYNTDLKRVDADCDVYEIPLAVNYNFKQSKNHAWFAGMGLSTLIMKSETYHYLYKNSQGQTMYRGWTLRNRNKHFLSVLTISGGYQYLLNQRISIIAEPFVKLPLQGIGFGKIKLNSGGVLITTAIKPFAKRK